jgi:ABC-type spermidine/putrescine transport system permease subunit I
MSQEPRKRITKASITPYIICAPAIILLVFFFLIPAINQLSLSFYKYLPPGTVAGKLYEATFTLENYRQFFTPTYLNDYFYPTIRIMFISTAVALILSYPVAYSMAKSSPRLRKVLITATMAAILVGPIVRVYSWLVILGKYGIIDNFLSILGLGRIGFLGTELGVEIGTTQFLLAYLILVLSVSIQNINPSYEDAARSLGANDAYTFVRITLPLSLPGIISAVLLGLTLSATMLETPMVLGFGITQMQGNLIFNEALGAVINWPFSSAASVVLLIMTLTISYGINYVLKGRIKEMK